MAELNVRLKMRSKPAAEWTEADILLKGELGFDTTNKLFKMGDGTTNWTALEAFYDPSEIHGSVNADNAVFTKDMTFTYQFGKFTPGPSGSVTVESKDVSVQDLLEMAFAVEDEPDVTQPSTSVTLTGAGAKEVGTEFTPSYSVGFNKGSYQYGPSDTGVTVTGYEVTDTSGGSSTTQTGSFTKFTVGDDTNYKVNVTTSYGDGAIPKTNLGNDYAAGQIKAGSKTASSAAVTGYRNMFFGTMTTKPADITSADIRALTTKQPKGNVTDKVINIPVGALRVMFAVPSDKQITSITDTNGLGAQILSSFTQTTVQVEGANAYTAIEYKVYYMDYASANDTANTYKVTVANA